MGSSSSKVAAALTELRGLKYAGEWRPSLAAFNALVTAEQLTAQTGGRPSSSPTPAAAASSEKDETAAGAPQVVIDCKDPKVLKTVLGLLASVLANGGAEADVCIVLETAIRLTFLQGLYKALGKASHAPFARCVRHLAQARPLPSVTTVHLALYLVHCIVRCPFSGTSTKALAKLESAARWQFDAAQGFAALAELLAASRAWRPRHVSFGVVLRRPLHVHAALMKIFCAALDGSELGSTSFDAAQRMLAKLRDEPGCFAVLLELSRAPDVQASTRAVALLTQALLASKPRRFGELQDAARISGALLWHFHRALGAERAAAASPPSSPISPESGDGGGGRSLSPTMRPSSPVGATSGMSGGRAAVLRSRDLVELMCTNNAASTAVLSAALPRVLFSRLRGTAVPGARRFSRSAATNGASLHPKSKSHRATVAEHIQWLWFSAEVGQATRRRAFSKGGDLATELRERRLSISSAMHADRLPQYGRAPTAVSEFRAWHVLWQCLESDWETSELVWNAETREELRAALAHAEHSLDYRRALWLTRQSFGNEDVLSPRFLHTRGVQWEPSTFCVFYPSLNRDLWVEGYCLRLLIDDLEDEGFAADGTRDVCARIAVRARGLALQLIARRLAESEPARQLLCLEALRAVAQQPACARTLMEQPFELMTSICALAGRSPTEVSRAQLIELMHVLMVILTRGPREWGEAAVVVSEAGPSGQMLLKLNVNAAENVRQLMEHRGVDAMLDHTLWCVEQLLRDGEEEVEADGGGEVDEDDDPFGDTGGGGGGGSGGVNHSPTTSDGSGEQARELALSMLRVLSVAGETFPSLLSELSQATALRPLALLLLVAAGGTVSTIINELGDANPDVHLRQRPVDSDLAAHLLNVLLPTLDQNPLAFPQLGATGIFELLLLLMCSIASDGSAEEGENSGICVLACSILQLCHRWRSNGDIAATTGTPPSYLAFFLPFELVALLDGNSVKFARIFCAQTPALQPDLIWGPQQRSHLVDVLCTRLQLDFVMHDEIEPGFEIDEMSMGKAPRHHHRCAAFEPPREALLYRGIDYDEMEGDGGGEPRISLVGSDFETKFVFLRIFGLQARSEENGRKNMLLSPPLYVPNETLRFAPFSGLELSSQVYTLAAVAVLPLLITLGFELPPKTKVEGKEEAAASAAAASASLAAPVPEDMPLGIKASRAAMFIAALRRCASSNVESAVFNDAQALSFKVISMMLSTKNLPKLVESGSMRLLASGALQLAEALLLNRLVPLNDHERARFKEMRAWVTTHGRPFIHTVLSSAKAKKSRFVEEDGGVEEEEEEEGTDELRVACLRLVYAMTVEDNASADSSTWLLPLGCDIVLDVLHICGFEHIVVGEDAEEESATQFQASAPVTAAALHCIHAMAVNRDRRASLLEHGALLVVLRTSVFFACASEEDEVVPTAAAALAALGNTQICAQHHSLPLLAVATAAAKAGQGEEFAPSTSKLSGRRDPALWSLLGAVLTPALLDVLCRSPAQFATLARAASSRGDSAMLVWEEREKAVLLEWLVEQLRLFRAGLAGANMPVRELWESELDSFDGVSFSKAWRSVHVELASEAIVGDVFLDVYTTAASGTLCLASCAGVGARDEEKCAEHFFDGLAAALESAAEFDVGDAAFDGAAAATPLLRAARVLLLNSAHARLSDALSEVRRRVGRALATMLMRAPHSAALATFRAAALRLLGISVPARNGGEVAVRFPMLTQNYGAVLHSLLAQSAHGKVTAAAMDTLKLLMAQCEVLQPSVEGADGASASAQAVDGNDSNGNENLLKKLCSAGLALALFKTTLGPSFGNDDQASRAAGISALPTRREAVKCIALLHRLCSATDPTLARGVEALLRGLLWPRGDAASLVQSGELLSTLDADCNTPTSVWTQACRQTLFTFVSEEADLVAETILNRGADSSAFAVDECVAKYHSHPEHPLSTLFVLSCRNLPLFLRNIVEGRPEAKVGAGEGGGGGVEKEKGSGSLPADSRVLCAVFGAVEFVLRVSAGAESAAGDTSISGFIGSGCGGGEKWAEGTAARRSFSPFLAVTAWDAREVIEACLAAASALLARYPSASGDPVSALPLVRGAQAMQGVLKLASDGGEGEWGKLGETALFLMTTMMSLVDVGKAAEREAELNESLPPVESSSDDGQEEDEGEFGDFADAFGGFEGADP